jgi:hypothetical protein
MDPFAKLVSRVLQSPATGLQESLLRHLGLASAAALFVFLLSLTSGLDLSPGLF